MNAETIRTNILNDQKWLERALIALDTRQVWHDDKDAQSGSYMVRWIRTQLTKRIKLGFCLTGDQWVGRARHLVQQYVPELMKIAYDKAVADAEWHKEQAQLCRAKAKKLRKELDKEPPQAEAS